MARTLLIAWATVLVGVIAAPLLSPGVLALRDMMVLDHPDLNNTALGFGDLPARSSPQDGVLALLGMLLPASWLVRVLIVATAALGAWGSAQLAQSGGPWGMAAGMTIGVYNPFIIERLLQGQWSLVLAAWLLPVLVASWRFAPLAALTPTGGLFLLLTARWRQLPAALLLCVPWIVPGFLAAGASTSATDLFAPRAEGQVGTLGALLGLGGIWNAEAVPPSREQGFALAGVALVLVLLAGMKAVPRRLLRLAGVGFGIALAGWLLPLEQLTAIIPGGGLLRDSQKFVALAIPAYVAACGQLRPLLAGGALCLALLQVPDGPIVLQQLRPIAINQEAIAAWRGRGDLLIAGTGTIVQLDHPVVNPWSKGAAIVEPGELLVDGQQVDPPNPRWLAATTATAAELADLGVAAVVTPAGQALLITDAPPAKLNRLGLGLLVLWLGVAILLLSGCWRPGKIPRAGARTDLDHSARTTC